MTTSTSLWLDPIPTMLHAQAREAFAAGNFRRFLMSAENTAGLALVWKNWEALRKRGIYEAALLDAFTSTRTNNAGWSASDLEFFFSLADRAQLLAAGEPLPGPGPFTLYRGVSGKGRRRRVRGLSWTSSIEKARWFADRYPGLDDPAVFRVNVEADAVLAYLHEQGRQEAEFIVMLPRTARVVRVERREHPATTGQP